MRLALSFFAPLALAGCLVTDVNPKPNRNSPPRILLPGVSNSITTPPDRVFLLAQAPTAGRDSNVELALDVEDDDSSTLTYRAFIIGPAGSGADAGVIDDGGVATTGFVRRFAEEGAIILSDGRGKVSHFVLTADRFIPTGQCYGVEVRVSSQFRDATNGPAPEEPTTEDDVASIFYWVASADTNGSIGLDTCPAQP